MSKMMAFETATRTIGECFPYIKNGANIKQDKEGDGIPITRIETISGGTFHRNRMGYANIHDAEKYQNWILHDGDILMSHINISQIWEGQLSTKQKKAKPLFTA